MEKGHLKVSSLLPSISVADRIIVLGGIEHIHPLDPREKRRMSWSNTVLTSNKSQKNLFTEVQSHKS